MLHINQKICYILANRSGEEKAPIFLDVT